MQNEVKISFVSNKTERENVVRTKSKSQLLEHTRDKILSDLK